MQGTPALWQAMLAGHEADLAGLRVLAGGEALPPALGARLRGAAAEVTNVYGPTEITVWATAAAARRGAGPVGGAGRSARRSVGARSPTPGRYVLDGWLRPGAGRGGRRAVPGRGRSWPAATWAGPG